LSGAAAPRATEGRLALTGSEPAAGVAARQFPLNAWSRLRAKFGGAEHLVQRLAGTVFLIRVASALLAYGSQVLFARWMGTFEFGIYVYVWTWVLLLGPILDLGLSTAAQRFIPQYRERKQLDFLRGYVSGARWLGFSIASVAAALCAGLVWMLRPWLDDYTVVPLVLACVCLPAFSVANIQDGISRSYDWVGLAIVPTYIVRQVLLTVMLGAACVAGYPVDAETAMFLACVAMWLPVIGQLLILNSRLHERVEPGPKAHEFKRWLATALPILLAEGFFFLLMYVDVLMLQQFRPPDDVAVYYAAAKTLALVSFIYYSVAMTAAHRFSSFHASGDHEGLARFLRQTIRWTFWPSLLATALLLALGRPLLSLFGPQFTAGYHLMFILAIGLLARASIGPIERLLNMLGQQRRCAMVYATAFGINMGLGLVLIPRLGADGAAIATASAILVETLALFLVARRRLGFHAFVFGRQSRR
jgi:O-antigen/teichoic acid export membrane protein